MRERGRGRGRGRGREGVGRAGDEREECVVMGWCRVGGPGEDESFVDGEEGGWLTEVAFDNGVGCTVWSSGACFFFIIGDLNGLERIESDSWSRLRFAGFIMETAREQKGEHEDVEVWYLDWDRCTRPCVSVDIGHHVLAFGYFI
jgi:hypothetical protein